MLFSFAKPSFAGMRKRLSPLSGKRLSWFQLLLASKAKHFENNCKPSNLNWYGDRV